MPPSTSYDVFLSYSHADAGQARELDEWLRTQGLKTFFDRRELEPGLRWVAAVEGAIARSRAVAILVGPNGIGNTQQYERELALVRQTQERELPVVPVLLPGCRNPPTGFLQLLTWVDLRGGMGSPDRPEGLQLLLSAIRRETVDSEAVRASICPYMGLDAFGEEDAAFFCGRDDAIRELAAKARQYPLVAVVGKSGSGKSSLVQAGLVPLLRQERATCVWDVVSFRPGAAPLHALARAFNPEHATASSGGMFQADARLEGEVAALRQGSPEQLARVVARRLEDAPERPDRLLIYVDQWEELYTVGVADDAQARTQHASDADRFIELLLGLSSGPAPRATVVLTVRADFYGALIGHSELGRNLQERQVNLGAMSRDELRAAISVPAERAGLRFSPPELVDQILQDAGIDETNLPLLQYALKETWARRERGLLTADAYVAAGRVQESIQTTAEWVYKALTAEGQALARRLFLGLVMISESTSPGQVQRRVRIRCAMPDDLKVRGIIEQFAHPKVRLLVTGSEPLPAAAAVTGDAIRVRPTVEIAHEALIRTWRTLAGWIDANQEKLRSRATILRQVRDWEDNGRHKDLLLQRGFQLERALKLLENSGDVPVDDLRDFVEASQRHSGDEAERAPGAWLRGRKFMRSMNVLLGSSVLLMAIGWLAYKYRPSAPSEESSAVRYWQFPEGAPRQIEVCWEDDISGFPLETRWTQDAVTQTWNLYSGVKFVGWGRCNARGGDVRIGIEDSWTGVMSLGQGVQGMTRGLILNFEFKNYLALECKDMKETCIRTIAVHEFGHALGLEHEHDRPDVPAECRQKIGAPGPYHLPLRTPYDPQSVMNYCNPTFYGNGVLSEGDKARLKQIYQ